MMTCVCMLAYFGTLYILISTPPRGPRLAETRAYRYRARHIISCVGLRLGSGMYTHTHTCTRSPGDLRSGLPWYVGGAWMSGLQEGSMEGQHSNEPHELSVQGRWGDAAMDAIIIM
eukprot:5224411-Pyramimonas_sp.AAC.1